MKQDQACEENVYKQPFLKIDRKNKFVYLDDDALIKLKISLYATLASIEEEIICKEMNKLIDRIIPQNKDNFKVNLSLSKQYYEKFYSFDKTQMRLPEEVKNSLDKIINTNFNMEFDFSLNNIEDLCRVLVYCFLQMSNSNFFFNNGSYKIKDFKEFKNSIDQIIFENIDLIKYYGDRFKTNEREDKNSIVSYSTRSSFSSSSANKFDRSKQQQFQIPTEMIILLNKFQTIKKLKLSIHELMHITYNAHNLMPFIIVLINIEWLFPNLFDVELDLKSGDLHKNLSDTFITTQMKSKKQIMHVKTSSQLSVSRNSTLSNNGRVSSMSFSKKSAIENNKILHHYLEIIRENKIYFEFIIIYSYIISKMQKLKILNLTFPDSFKNETEKTLKLSDITMGNFQFLNYLIPIDNLFQLSVEFNALDAVSFEKVLSIFQKNNYLKSFKICLFPAEEHYSFNSLFKLYSSLNINNVNFMNMDSINESDNENILQRLLDLFEDNLEKFFFVFQTKMNLFEYHLKADLPLSISSNENYINVLHKFVFNHFILLNNEELSIQTLKINIPFLSFDNRKYPSLCEFFQTINLHYKQRKLSNLTISLQFYKMNNISNVITSHLRFLKIGDFDLITFSNFLKFFEKNKEFNLKSQLTCLEISMSNLIYEFKPIFGELKIFLQRNIPRSLKEFSLITSTIPSKEDFLLLFKTINNDRIERYCFEFNMISLNSYNQLKLPEIKYRIENKKLNRNLITTLSLLSKIFNKKDFMNFNVFSNIQKFLETFVKKLINVGFR